MFSFDSYSFWEEDYQNLESDFLNFIKYVPLYPEHEDVWSFKLVNQLLLIGSSIDSFFKCAMHSLKKTFIINPLENGKYNFEYESNGSNYACMHCGIGYVPEDFKEESNFYKNLLNDKNPNMGLYRNIFQDYYKLSDKSIYVLRNKEELKPFKEWNDGKSPEWWNAYTKLKHSRFENRKLATLKMVLNALAALFLLNVYHVDNREYLVNNGIIRGNLNLSQDYRNFFSSLKPINTLGPIIAKTNLFGYVWETKSSLWNQHPWQILDPGNVYGI